MDRETTEDRNIKDGTFQQSWRRRDEREWRCELGNGAQLVLDGYVTFAAVAAGGDVMVSRFLNGAPPSVLASFEIASPLITGRDDVLVCAPPPALPAGGVEWFLPWPCAKGWLGRGMRSESDRQLSCPYRPTVCALACEGLKVPTREGTRGGGLRRPLLLGEGERAWIDAVRERLGDGTDEWERRSDNSARTALGDTRGFFAGVLEVGAGDLGAVFDFPFTSGLSTAEVWVVGVTACNDGEGDLTLRPSTLALISETSPSTPPVDSVSASVSASLLGVLSPMLRSRSFSDTSCNFIDGVVTSPSTICILGSGLRASCRIGEMTLALGAMASRWPLLESVVVVVVVAVLEVTPQSSRSGRLSSSSPAQSM